MQTQPADLQLPAKPENLSSLEFIRNLTTYVAARRIVAGKTVADVGCGTGHGAWLLAKSGAERVAALDTDEARIRQVAGLCTRVENFSASVMDAQRLEFEDHSFQVITCFEVIEHVPRPGMLLSGVRRVLAGDGVALLSTPNRTVRLLPLQRPWNRQHMREYTASAFHRVLAKHFPSLAILGIGGDPEPYEYYRKLWRQDPWRVYTSWVTLPARALRRITTRRRTRTQIRPSTPPRSPNSDSALLNMAVPTPDAESWPFYVGGVDRHCLNFFALCGFDDEVIEKAAREIKRSDHR